MLHDWSKFCQWVSNFQLSDAELTEKTLRISLLLETYRFICTIVAYFKEVVPLTSMVFFFLIWEMPAQMALRKSSGNDVDFHSECF